MSTYQADPEADYTDYDEDDDSDDDDVTAVRLAQLEQENARLKAQLGTRPKPKPVGDLDATLASAQSREQVLEAIAQHNAAIAAANPEPEPPEIDHEELQARIAAANSPEELQALLVESGFTIR